MGWKRHSKSAVVGKGKSAGLTEEFSCGDGSRYSELGNVSHKGLPQDKRKKEKCVKTRPHHYDF